MPYIEERKRRYSDIIAETSGELNYQITKLIVQYVSDHDLSYRTINDVLGALEGAKLEFYRRVAAPYEDQKIQENGDVY
jgi:hypothetical protein